MPPVEPEHRRVQILESARRVFGARGYVGSRVEDIIATAGIARGTFYLYFKSKRDVFDAILDDLFVLIRGSIAMVDPQDRERTALEQLRANVDRAMDVLLHDPDITRILLLAAIGLDEDFDTKLDSFYGSVCQMLENSLLTGQNLGLVRRDLDRAVAARAVLGATKELLYRVVVAGDSIDRSRLCAGLLDVTLRGIWLPSS